MCDKLTFSVSKDVHLHKRVSTAKTNEYYNAKNYKYQSQYKPEYCLLSVTAFSVSGYLL